MRRPKNACLAAGVVFFSLVLIAGNAFAQAEPQAAPSRGDFNALIQETQKKSDKSGEMSFVWWIPLEYWEYSFAQNPSVGPQQAERVVSVFKPYTLIAVVDGTMGQYGAVTYRPEEEVRRHVKLRDSKGLDYSPLAEADVSVEAKSFLAAMKPVLSSVLGPMGQNMYFFLFPARDNGGQEISNAKKQGQLSVFLGEREFTWKLPLSSVLPPKSCPVCGAKVSGAYSFCPWDGAKLENSEPAS
ncbi:MAG: hypothetical protein PHR11_02705 [Candidatus Omnitrophica bacterium]|nr:hypothetical protein [Candidatus Omnitrophota bacterium]